MHGARAIVATAKVLRARLKAHRQTQADAPARVEHARQELDRAQHNLERLPVLIAQIEVTLHAQEIREKRERDLADALRAAKRLEQQIDRLRDARNVGESVANA